MERGATTELEESRQVTCTHKANSQTFPPLGIKLTRLDMIKSTGADHDDICDEAVETNNTRHDYGKGAAHHQVGTHDADMNNTETSFGGAIGGAETCHS